MPEAPLTLVLAQESMPIESPPFPSPARRAPPLGALLLAALLAACSSESGDDGETEVDDGRYHPSSNGVRVDESSACESVSRALRDRALELRCSMTLRPCPELLRVQFQTPCLQYDQGTVSGCASYYGQQAGCAALEPNGCALVAYPGTEPAGCPQ